MTQLVVTRLSTGHQRNCGYTVGKAGDRSLLQTIRTGPGAHPVKYAMHTEGLFS